jgi:hypothetical protein
LALLRQRLEALEASLRDLEPPGEPPGPPDAEDGPA